MIPIKTPTEIKIMKEGGRRLSQVLSRVLAEAKPGIQLKKLESLADSLIKKSGGQPSFKMVENYRWATCLNINQGVVHGIPNDYRLKTGDLLSADVGLFYRGFHADMARTIRVRAKSDPSSTESPALGKPKARPGRRGREKQKAKSDVFLETGRRALEKAIEVARPGNRVGHISAVIEKEIKKAGYRPIESLTGHGVGRQLHEEPAIPCLLRSKVSETLRLNPGMVLAIEVIYSQKKPEIVVKSDGWTVETEDGSPAGLFENTVAITSEGPLVLTGLSD